MDSPVERTFSLSQSLVDQAERLSQRLNLTPGQFFAAAVENFIHENQTAASDLPKKREFHQGDIYWVPVEEPGISHPCVIIQADVLNRSRIHSLVVCALTTNIKRAKSPGNVLLEAGEGNLPRQSVVEVSKVSAVFKTQLGAYIGSLSGKRVDQILAGMQFLQSLTGRG